MISHDIRTPVTAILGNTELLTETRLTPEQLDYLNDVKLSSESLLGLLNDMLDFAKMEAGKLTLAPSEFSLRDLVSATLRMLAVTAHKKGLELIQSIDPAVPDELVGDVDPSRQIIVNLISNALKFTEQPPLTCKIELLSSHQYDLSLHGSVSDTGIGIPSNRMEAIFREFGTRRQERVPALRWNRFGLGNCSQLVAAMGGRIWVESDVGVGSRFHFTVRLRRQALRKETDGKIQRLHRLRALVADDNRANLQVSP